MTFNSKLSTVQIDLSEISDSEQKKKITGKQKNIWELDRHNHCPIIGTCLSNDELRKIFKKNGVKGAAKMPDYSVHGQAVSYSREKNKIAKQIQKLLNRKYSTFIKKYKTAKTGTELLELWEEDYSRGVVQGPFWAVMSHPVLTREIDSKLIGEIHILSHTAAANYLEDKKRLHEFENQVTSLKAQLQSQKNKARDQLSSANDLFIKTKEQLLETRNELGRTKEKLEEVKKCIPDKNDKDGVENLKNELAVITEENAKLRKQLNQSKSEIRKVTEEKETLLVELSEREAEIAALDWKLSAQMSFENDSCVINQETDCPCNRWLSGQIVLYVGGKAGLVRHYEQLISESGGGFIHHDGGLEQSPHHLQMLLDKADIVFCPVECISHNAANLVKQKCKKARKRCIFLRSSGISSLVKSLGEIGGQVITTN